MCSLCAPTLRDRAGQGGTRTPERGRPFACDFKGIRAKVASRLRFPDAGRRVRIPPPPPFVSLHSLRSAHEGSGASVASLRAGRPMASGPLHGLGPVTGSR